MTFPRKTVAETLSFEGVGLHSGLATTAVVHPFENGIEFSFAGDRFQAIPENVTDTSRCTRLGTISTIEHLMAAFSGVGVTDASVEVTTSEMPALDGSASEYANRIAAAGFESLGEGERPSLYRKLFHSLGAAGIAISKGTGMWRYEYDTGSRWPQKQVFEADLATVDFQRDVARARTFALSEEVPALVAAGFGKGLDGSSVLILGPRGYENEARFVDEPARHKLLDLLGDLYLSGVPCTFINVVAERSGHRANVEAAAQLYRYLQEVG